MRRAPIDGGIGKPDSLSYSMPKFSELQTIQVIDRGRSVTDRAQGLIDQSRAANAEAQDWIDLANEMFDHDAITVADLGPDRVKYWERKLHRPVVVRF